MKHKQNCKFDNWHGQHWHGQNLHSLVRCQLYFFEMYSYVTRVTNGQFVVNFDRMMLERDGDLKDLRIVRMLTPKVRTHLHSSTCKCMQTLTGSSTISQAICCDIRIISSRHHECQGADSVASWHPGSKRYCILDASPQRKDEHGIHESSS